MFVKLQRPPPEMAIFLPILSECSITRTLRLRFPASIAQNNPAAPPPITITSQCCDISLSALGSIAGCHLAFNASIRHEPHDCDEHVHGEGCPWFEEGYCDCDAIKDY